MKKIALLIMAAAAVGCATTGNTENNTSASVSSINAQTLTLEQALQKSAETRQKLLEAKQQYQQAKTAAEVAAGKKTVADAAQEQIQNQLNTAKKQLQDEKNAWADLLK